MANETSEGLKDAIWVAKFLGLSRSWVYEASASGVLPCIKIGAALRFDAETIRAWARGDRTGKIVTLPGCRGRSTRRS